MKKIISIVLVALFIGSVSVMAYASLQKTETVMVTGNDNPSKCCKKDTTKKECAKADKKECTKADKEKCTAKSADAKKCPAAEKKIAKK